MMIPGFRDDGYLPEGLHLATEAEVISRFGRITEWRERLAARLQRWIALSRAVAAQRLFVDGSFVTAEPQPKDIDAVVWLGDQFAERVSRGEAQALELQMMLLKRQPEEIYGAGTRRDWDDWLEFFSRTREADGRRKGLVEIEL